MTLARSSLYFMALTFLGPGMMSLVSPAILAALVEIPLTSPIAVMELRSIYGGLFLGLGVFFLLSARRDAWIRPGLVAQVSIMGAFVAARLIGVFVDGPPSGFIALLFGWEIAGVVIGYAALTRDTLGRADEEIA